MISLLATCLALPVFGAATDPTKTLRLEANEAHKTVRLSIHEGDTPLVRCYLYQNREAWTLDGTESAKLAYSVADWDDATNMVEVTGTVTANAYVDFQFDTNDTATNGQFYGQIQVSDGDPVRSWVWSELRLEIRKSPIGSAGTLTLDTPPLSTHAADASAHHVKYTDAEALAAAIAGGCITSGVDVAGNNTFTGTNTFTKTINGTTTNATALSGTAGATVVSGAALGATSVQVEADAIAIAALGVHTGLQGTAVHGLGSASLSNGTDFASAAQGALADSALQAESDPVWTNAQAVGFTMGGDITMTGTSSITWTNLDHAAVRAPWIGAPLTAGFEEQGAFYTNGWHFSPYDQPTLYSDTGDVIMRGSQLLTKWTHATAPTVDSDVANKKYVDDTAGGGGGFPVAVEPWYNADFSQAAGNSAPYANWDSANGIYGRTLSASNNTKQAWVDSYVTTGGVFVLRSPVGWETGTYGSAWDAVMGICNGTSLSPFSYVTNSVSFSHTNTAAFTAGNDIEWGRWTNSVGSGFYRFVLDKGNTPAGNDTLGILGTPSISVE